MSSWKPRRFWTDVGVEEVGDGFALRLDGKVVRTPHRAELVLPTRGLADAVAAEWEAQAETLDPATMPYTRAANTAIDKVRLQHAAVCEIVAAYGATDLLCYRAEGPAALSQRQADTWDPYLDWADGSYGARLRPVAGIMPTEQDADALARLADQVRGVGPFSLTGLHDLVTLSGSLVLGLAAYQGFADPASVWKAARLDEDWQAEQWGADEEAQLAAGERREAFLQAHRFTALLSPHH